MQLTAKRITIAAAICCAFGSTAAYAQSAADLENARRQAEQLQRQEQDRIQRDREDALRQLPPGGTDTRQLTPEIKVPALGAKCRDINEIVITGADKMWAMKRDEITSQFVGQCLGVVEIERLLAEITKDYIDRGYVTTRAYLPPQDLTKGRLEILVVEGKVEKIMFEDENGRASLVTAFPGVEGDILDLRDLEQGIDQLNRLQSNNASMDIRPGSESGASTVVIRNASSYPLHASFTVDNQGSRSTGRHQYGFTVSADSLFGLNEFIMATHREAVPDPDARTKSISDSFFASIPFGYSLLTFTTSQSEYTSRLYTAGGQVLKANGISDNTSLRLDHVAYRDQVSRFGVGAAITAKETRSYLAGQLLGVSSRKLTILDLDTNFSTALAGGVFAITIGYSKGLHQLSALQDADNLPDWAPRAQFDKWRYSLDYTRPFRALEENFLFTSSVTGQVAMHTLYGSEQITIGGLYSVRGFTDNNLSGDHGYYWRNELSMRKPVAVGNQSFNTRFFVGLDTGRVWNRTAEIPEGSMTGAAVGASVAWKGLNWELFTTHPISAPHQFHSEGYQTWFRLTYAI
ncbi:ShlB/FhaC/HecB family hemolysin secretion/activation protein [Azoarcus sp. TTM-91]|uniref:ShlB/FhaC/HecB family hemolysin secretion/activation protein n=1 Tax=Azoarcus sp. TTM-91 TaxID=2691581 RepID=UPI00145CD955|nr:ShlB/FhaC/HecB family hemolysin secretion/activation protein [Azoarcus sp. TTM-91]NMG32874.1 ShlB/FhaC/HecB family hemolysin secretion/activation protein [Azoarcus sp. TTM-91]